MAKGMERPNRKALAVIGRHYMTQKQMAAILARGEQVIHHPPGSVEKGDKFSGSGSRLIRGLHNMPSTAELVAGIPDATDSALKEIDNQVIAALKQRAQITGMTLNEVIAELQNAPTNEDDTSDSDDDDDNNDTNIVVGEDSGAAARAARKNRRSGSGPIAPPLLPTDPAEMDQIKAAAAAGNELMSSLANNLTVGDDDSKTS